MSKSFFRDLPRFQVQVTTLSEGDRIALNVSIPTGLRVAGKNYGINTYRANVIASGEISFQRPGEVPFSKVASESPQESRVAISGEYWLEGVASGLSKFVCVLVKEPQDNLIDYVIHSVAPGQSLTIETADKGKDYFACNGTLKIAKNTIDVGDTFIHLEIGSQRNVSIENIGSEVAHFIEIVPITKAQALATAEIIHPSEYTLIEWLNN